MRHIPALVAVALTALFTIPACADTAPNRAAFYGADGTYGYHGSFNLISGQDDYTFQGTLDKGGVYSTDIFTLDLSSGLSTVKDSLGDFSDSFTLTDTNGKAFQNADGTFNIGAFYSTCPQGSTTCDSSEFDVLTPTSPTPEPSTLALLGTGVLGIGGVLRRRKLT